MALLRKSQRGIRLEEPVPALKGDPQLIPVDQPLGEGLAAGSKEGQQKFLEMFGLVKTDLPIQDENVPESDIAELIATALNHTSKGGAHLLQTKFVYQVEMLALICMVILNSTS